MRCARGHCQGCPRTVRVGLGRLTVCAHCDGLLAPLAAGAPVKPLMLRAFSKDGALTALALALPAWVAIMYAPLAALLYAAALAGYYLATIDHVARGQAGLPEPPMSALDVASMVGKALRGLLVVAVGGLPFVLWSVLGGSDAGSPVGGLGPTLALHVIGFVWLPAAVLSLVLTGSALAAVSPLTWAAVIRRAPGAYGRFCGLFFISTLGAVMLTAGAGFFLAPIPYLGPLLVVALANLLFTSQAALFGGFLTREALVHRAA